MAHTKRQQSLIWLYKSLVDDGYFHFSRRHEISSNKSVLYITYLDFLFIEQFILVFRTSANSYRIYYGDELIRTRSVKSTLDTLYAIRDAIIDTNNIYNYMTLKDLKTFDKTNFSLYKRITSEIKNIQKSLD